MLGPDQPVSSSPEVLHQFWPSHVWKSDISEHKIYPAIVLFKNPERPSSMRGWQDDIPGSFENLSYGPLKAFLVFCEKDMPVMAACARHFSRRCL